MLSAPFISSSTSLLHFTLSLSLSLRYRRRHGGGRAPLLPRSPASGFAGGGDAAGSSHRRPTSRSESILKVALSDCLC
uniref:Uncharacterized protein n=1 Tax=Oryza punctata TaxID=4537 RepID=A0A0E0JG28_ORYPU